MKFWLRCAADALAIFLALYLVDTLSEGGFKMREVWVAVLLAMLLGLFNGSMRPFRWVRRKPFLAVSETVLVVLINVLVLQVFLWFRAPLSVRGFGWVLVAAAFVSLLAGVINWLIGYKSREKARTPRRESKDDRPRRRVAGQNHTQS